MSDYFYSLGMILEEEMFFAGDSHARSEFAVLHINLANEDNQ